MGTPALVCEVHHYGREAGHLFYQGTHFFSRLPHCGKCRVATVLTAILSVFLSKKILSKKITKTPVPVTLWIIWFFLQHLLNFILPFGNFMGSKFPQTRSIRTSRLKQNHSLLSTGPTSRNFQYHRDVLIFEMILKDRLGYD